MTDIRISHAGENALLLDASSATFRSDVQARVINAANALGCHTGVKQAIPGVNNLLIIFDIIAYDPSEAWLWLEEAWGQATSHDPDGRLIEIPVHYSHDTDTDMEVIMRYAGLTVAEVIQLHANALYRVNAIGAMPGFVYLSGLSHRLAIPRRQVPRLVVEKGAVIIGGGNAGVMPCTAPTGWYQLGRTDFELFDSTRNSPCFFQIGDRVRFVEAQ